MNQLGHCQTGNWVFLCPTQDELVLDVNEHHSESTKSSCEGVLISPMA